LLLGLASAIFLGSESRGTQENYLLVFYKEKEREKRNFEVVVRYEYAILGGVEKTICSV
jgi:hypothetical protein